MNIIENIIPPNTGVRTSKKLKDLRGLVVHWIGVPQSRASVIRKNFERDECGTHYIIDWIEQAVRQNIQHPERNIRQELQEEEEQVIHHNSLIAFSKRAKVSSLPNNSVISNM